MAMFELVSNPHGRILCSCPFYGKVLAKKNWTGPTEHGFTTDGWSELVSNDRPDHNRLCIRLEKVEYDENGVFVARLSAVVPLWGVYEDNKLSLTVLPCWRGSAEDEPLYKASIQFLRELVPDVEYAMCTCSA